MRPVETELVQAVLETDGENLRLVHPECVTGSILEVGPFQTRVKTDGGSRRCADCGMELDQ